MFTLLQFEKLPPENVFNPSFYIRFQFLHFFHRNVFYDLFELSLPVFNRNVKKNLFASSVLTSRSIPYYFCKLFFACLVQCNSLFHFYAICIIVFCTDSFSLLHHKTFLIFACMQGKHCWALRPFRMKISVGFLNKNSFNDRLFAPFIVQCK